MQHPKVTGVIKLLQALEEVTPSHKQPWSPDAREGVGNVACGTSQRPSHRGRVMRLAQLQQILFHYVLRVSVVLLFHIMFFASVRQAPRTATLLA